MNNLFDAISTYAKQDPIREAIVSADRTVSYAELNIQVDQLSAELIQMKIQKHREDRMLICILPMLLPQKQIRRLYQRHIIF